jgi:hypothetical protein
VGTLSGGVLHFHAGATESFSEAQGLPDPPGHFHSFEFGSGPFEVNPNAMLVTTSYVFAGTLGQGLYVYDRQSARWSSIRDGLPSSNVTALAATNGYIYVGTDNGLVRIPEQKLHL